MSESPIEDPSKPESEEPIQKIRTEEPQAPFGEDAPDPNVAHDLTADEKGPGEPVQPGLGGYAGRDPKTEMPAVPSVEETQGDAPEHGGEPPQTGGERDVND